MIATSHVYSHKRKDGSLHKARRLRYLCTRRNRFNDRCDGQTVYMSDKIDNAVNTVIREYLSRIKTTAKSVALEKRYETEIVDLKSQKREIEQERKTLKERLAQLTSEISKTLTGESIFTPEMVASGINEAKEELQKAEDKLAQLNYELNNTQGAMKKIDFYYDQFQGWADVFDKANLAQRKMILCQLIKEINVSKDYELDIVLDMNYSQFLSAS